MFLGYQNDKIAFIAETREELENMPCVTLDKIEETDKTYFLHNGEYVCEITVEEQQSEVRTVRNNYLEKYVDPKQLVLVWDSLSEDNKKLYADYRTYLLDYTNTEDWWLQNPMTFDEWLLIGTDEEVVSEMETAIDIVD